MNSNKITTKAETLVFLSKNNFPVPKSYFFTVKEWEFDEKSILDKILKQFKEYKFIAIRSSSLLEDSESNSMAGFFESFLNVDLGNKVHIKKLINKVISSYKYDELNQVLIQNMINNVKLSGVLMTKVHDDGSPYYVINFDDTTQNTDSVTSGNSINKTVYIYNGYKEEHFDNEYLLEVLKVVKNLEKTYFKTPLDIEFAVDENKEVIIFQVRPITTSNKWTKEASDLIPKRLPYLENFIAELMLRRNEIYGETSLLGIMPDWNPAEMIGTVPNPLAFSLYRELITKSTWRISREKMGYKELPNLELMVSLFGRPYIDVRNSINSFLPKGLSPKISEKLVNRYIKKLDSNPQLHDKIEFEVVFTVFEFNFKELFKKRYPNLLSKSELNEFDECMFKLTNNAIDINCKNNSLNKAEKKINKLIELHKKSPPKNLNLQTYISDHLNTLLNECINFGTIPFGIAARHGFITEILMRSLVKIGSISEDRIKSFKKSIKTISTELSVDYYKVCNGGMNKDDFLNRYGHLRPSSYDIMSPTYLEREYLFDGNPSKPAPHEIFKLSNNEITKINKAIENAGFKTDALGLFKYFEKSIKSREYFKFIFTKHLSFIIDSIYIWGNMLGFSREDLSLLSISDIKDLSFQPMTEDLKEYYLQKVKNNRLSQKVANLLKLNYLIRSEKDVYIAPIQRSNANFIGDKIIEGEIVLLSPLMKKIPTLDNKIICIEGADPGYDWIFSQKIIGLITKFGGVNSHMAIRCAEYDIPAAIGCGEQPFNKIINAQRILLNCKTKQLEPLKI